MTRPCPLAIVAMDGLELTVVVAFYFRCSTSWSLVPFGGRIVATLIRRFPDRFSNDSHLSRAMVRFWAIDLLRLARSVICDLFTVRVRPDVEERRNLDLLSGRHFGGHQAFVKRRLLPADLMMQVPHEERAGGVKAGLVGGSGVVPRLAELPDWVCRHSNTSRWSRCTVGSTARDSRTPDVCISYARIIFPYDLKMQVSFNVPLTNPRRYAKLPRLSCD
jgi:hypothetical protein